MKNKLLLLVTFALGIYVGRPTEIQLLVPESKCYTPPQKMVLASPGGSIDVAQEHVAAPKPSPSPAPSESPKAEGETTVHDTDSTCPEWAASTVADAAKWVAKYEVQDPYRLTFSTGPLPCLAEVRKQAEAANMQVSEEGQLNVGDYKYYVLITGK